MVRLPKSWSMWQWTRFRGSADLFRLRLRAAADKVTATWKPAGLGEAESMAVDISL